MRRGRLEHRPDAASTNCRGVGHVRPGLRSRDEPREAFGHPRAQESTASARPARERRPPLARPWPIEEEVPEVDVALRVEEDVGAVHVAVGDPLPVRERERGRRLLDDAGCSPRAPRIARGRRGTGGFRLAGNATRRTRDPVRASSRTIGTMCGCSSAATALGVGSNRRTNAGSVATASRKTLTATSRPTVRLDRRGTRHRRHRLRASRATGSPGAAPP